MGFTAAVLAYTRLENFWDPTLMPIKNTHSSPKKFFKDCSSSKS